MSSICNKEISQPIGFGDYPLSEGRSFAQVQAAAKAKKAFFFLLYGALVALSVFILPVSLPLAVIGMIVFSYEAIQTLVTSVGILYRSPPARPLKKGSPPPLNTLCEEPCSGFPTFNAVASHEWKIRLIREAKHSILMSGCYCGGTEFDETLKIIREQMRSHPSLVTSILSSDQFVTPQNKEGVGALRREFGDRFTFTMIPEMFPYLSPTTDRFTITSNHTKTLVIDSGAAFIIGGSGILSSWSRETGCQEPRPTENKGFLYDSFLGIRGFRDMDFVFQSPVPNGIGTRIHAEMVKLVERFQGKPLKLPPPSPSAEPIHFPASCDSLKVACYATGPEHPSCSFHDELVRKVESATKSIWIDHMYFHPTPRLHRALIDASKRGVRITLLTNKAGDQSPSSHFAYAELSRYYAKTLFQGKKSPHIGYYEYRIPYATLHKKVVVIDEKTTLLGSANMGKKSLEGFDYEMNLKVESAPFAQSVIDVLEEDKTLCEENTDPAISLKTRLSSSFQSLLMPIL